MEANEINILTAPQLVTSSWWSTLDRIQRIFLILFIVLYGVATVFTSVEMIVDDFYLVNLELKSFDTAGRKVESYFNLSLTIHRGFWRTEIVKSFPNESLGYTSLEFENHLKIGEKLWHTCLIMSYRGSPCESAGVFCVILGIAVFYCHFATFVLFRVITILIVSLSSFVILIGFGLLCASAQEYINCLTRLNSDERGQQGYFHNRRFKPTLSFNSYNFKFMIVNIFVVLLPLIIVGIYLLLFKRTNL